jgi:dihydropyrimidinase
MQTMLIVNANIVTAVDHYVADILIENGRIRTIGTNLPRPPDISIHDASGLLVLPGGVDPHSHLDWDFGTAIRKYPLCALHDPCKVVQTLSAKGHHRYRV